jgi:hypothetical protein
MSLESKSGNTNKKIKNIRPTGDFGPADLGLKALLRF